MIQWKSALTLTVAAAMVATTAFAQSDKGGSNASSPAATPSTSADKPAGAGAGNNATSPSASPSTTKPSGANSSTPSSAPSASPSTSKPESTKSDTMKSDTMKSDTMKSDTMKSDKTAKGRGMKMSGGNREQVKAAQQALKDKGHDPGAVDGVMGPKTKSALRDFQKKEGIQTTGRLDQDTMSKLGVEAKTSSTGAADTPSASPSTTAPSAGTPSVSPSDSASPDKKSETGDKKSDTGAPEKK